MRQIAFTPDAFKEYNDSFSDAEIIDKIKILLRDIDRDPFRGLGKPEPLREIGRGIGAEESIMNTGLFIKFQKPR